MPTRARSARPAPASFLLFALLLGALAAPAAVSLPDDGGRPSARTAKVGYLIPSQCQPAEDRRDPAADPASAWPAPHTTECALRSGCIASGYGLWVMEEARFYRLAPEAQALALGYFRATERPSHNEVVVVGDFSDAQAVRVEDLVATGRTAPAGGSRRR